MRGELERLEGVPALTPADTQQLLYRVLSTEQQKRLEIDRQIDTSHSVPGLARFRVNIYFQRESLGAAFRVIPEELKTLEELGLPASLAELAMLPRGLVLVTGPTGSGKSTTLAAMIDEVNRNRTDHILTIEDPIEFVHRHKRCIVNQREIGVDATSFAEALRAALRQDPDVILVGEMRDLETIGTALTAAETGHLVLGTLHTASAPGTIDRIIDVFPAEQQEQVRMMLAGSLQGVITQALLKTADGRGPRRSARDPASGRRRPEPDPPGQGRADLLDHADGHRPRDDDDGAVAREPRPAPRDRAGHRARVLQPRGPAPRPARARRLRASPRSICEPPSLDKPYAWRGRSRCRTIATSSPPRCGRRSSPSSASRVRRRPRRSSRCPGGCLGLEEGVLPAPKAQARAGGAGGLGRRTGRDAPVAAPRLLLRRRPSRLRRSTTAG